MSSNTIEELNKATGEFEKKYGLALTLKANLAAINKMLIKRGRGEEMLENIKSSIEEFEKSQKVAMPKSNV